MTMKLLNPIQLLRGTSADIAAAQGKEGTLYYDTDRGTLQVRGYDKLYAMPRLQENILESFVIHVNASAGSDSNSGYTQDKPLRTLNRALEIVQGICGIRRPVIRMYAGDYTWDDSNPGIDTSVAFIGAESGVILNVSSLSVFSAYISFTNITILLSKNIQALQASLGFTKCTITGDYSTTTGSLIVSTRCSYIYISGTTIENNNKQCFYCVLADHSSCVIFSEDNGSNTIRNISTSGATIGIGNNSAVYVQNTIVNGGNVVGRRYFIDSMSIINVVGRGENDIPGDSSGVVQESSVYI